MVLEQVDNAREGLGSNAGREGYEGYLYTHLYTRLGFLPSREKAKN